MDTSKKEDSAMLSERITRLFSVLQCNNTQIARFAGCSSGNISKLKTGNRAPKPTSKTIASFVGGVYGYADYENLLPLLAELCGAETTDRERLIPALIVWLYETEDMALPSRSMTPKSKQARVRQRQTFGERLDQVMTLLDLSNGQLASRLNVDASMVSRYRTGLYTPQGNNRLSKRLTSILLGRAEKKGLLPELEKLCGLAAGELDADGVAHWLYGVSDDDFGELAQKLLRSLDAFIPGQDLPPHPPALPPVETASCYWGTEGLRSAVARFLSDAAGEGGELLLYSDEPMDWLSGDREYFALWAALMVACVKSGVKIRIIHNVDRDGPEMIDAITGWLPLYISGMIEPYVFKTTRNARFCHTVFLHAGKACVHGFFPAGGKCRWYDYLTDAPRLDMLEREFSAMLSTAAPFLKTYPAAMGEAFRALRMDKPGTRSYLLTGFPVVTMPENLLARMLSRAGMGEEKRAETLELYCVLRERFSEVMVEDGVNMILCPSGAAVERRVNFSLDLVDLSLDYTPEEYAEHMAAVVELVKKERNFHLTLLPEAPFRDIQLVTLQDAVAVLRCREPYTAFVFQNPALTRSVSDYLSLLIEHHAEDRRTMIDALEG